MKELKEYLERKNITAYKFAKDNGFSPQNVLNWAKGTNKPKLEYYLQILQIIKN